MCVCVAAPREKGARHKHGPHLRDARSTCNVVQAAALCLAADVVNSPAVGTLDEVEL